VTETSRRVYLGLGRAFVAIGGGMAFASLLDRAAGWGFFRASPVGTAAFLVVIGVLLLWTVRQADRHGDPARSDATDDHEPRP